MTGKQNAPTVRRARLQYPKKKILFVASNPATLKGIPVGFYAEELTRAVFDFVRAGHEVDLVSPKGGTLQLDFMSDPENPATVAPNDLISLGFARHERFGEMLENTKSIEDVDIADYDAVWVVGGGAPLVTFKDDEKLHKFIADFYEQGKVVAMVCHGSCLLLWTRLSDGTLLADGKTWTGFPDSEEDLVDQSVGMKVNEYRIETEARKNPRTTFECAGPYEPFAVRDGRLITAQQQNSTFLLSQMVIEALAETDGAERAG